jgi:hypothetical protein
MPEWSHTRAKHLIPEMKKTYGPEKAKEVAHAVATMQSHALGKSPRTFHGKPFGTARARHEAKQKYDQPSKMQKAAFMDLVAPLISRPLDMEKDAGIVQDLLDKIRRRRERHQGMAYAPEQMRSSMSPQGTAPNTSSGMGIMPMGSLQMKVADDQSVGFSVTDHEGRSHWLDASGIKNKTDLEKAVAPLVSKCPHGVVRQKIDESWAAFDGHRRGRAQQQSGQPAVEKTGMGRGLGPGQGEGPGAALGPGAGLRLGPGRGLGRGVAAGLSRELTDKEKSTLKACQEKRGAGAPSEEEVVKFFSENPNSGDDKVHAWAESHGWNPDEAEKVIYRLATRHAQFAAGGEANKEGKKPSDFSPDQISKGVKVEREHTPNPKDQLRIAIDHLSENPAYYNDPLFKSDLAKAGELLDVVPHFLSTLFMTKEGTLPRPAAGSPPKSPPPEPSRLPLTPAEQIKKLEADRAALEAKKLEIDSEVNVTPSQEVGRHEMLTSDYRRVSNELDDVVRQLGELKKTSHLTPIQRAAYRVMFLKGLAA